MKSTTASLVGEKILASQSGEEAALFSASLPRTGRSPTEQLQTTGVPVHENDVAPQE